MAVKTAKKFTLTAAVKDKLAKLQLHNNTDIILFRPLRYENHTKLTPLSAAQIGQTILIAGTVLRQQIRYQPKKQLLLEVSDTEQKIFFIRFFHFYPDKLKEYAAGTPIRAFGELRTGFYGPEMVHPEVLSHPDSCLNTTLTPVYSTVRGLGQNTLRRLITTTLLTADLTDTLPDTLLKSYGLITFAQAVHGLHAPKPNQDSTSEFINLELSAALRRLKFDELLAQQLSMRLLRRQRVHIKKTIMTGPDPFTPGLIAVLPFTLTRAQERVSAEISADLKRPYPMHRLLQGDVGSGKTIVAALAAVKIIAAGLQVAIVAPTEILARQHFLKFCQWLKPLNIKVGWLCGGQSTKEKEDCKKKIAAGSLNLTVGTHALMQKDVVFKNLGLIIIDEQHRFGVNQRLLLKEKGQNTHQLMMSATPIPRTLSMTYFADVDLSVIDELPPNRNPVKTILCTMRRRAEVENFVSNKMLSGRQIYWVCPLIEESEVLQLQTAINCYRRLTAIFPDFNIGLIHGKLKAREKEAVMNDFRDNKIQLLVATTVIEVGVDVANAAVMVIEHAERLGLSQLHQLRGRVGRGDGIESACILLYQEPLSEPQKERLKIMYTCQDGFAIAQKDLLMRGPGEFLGAKQSGIPLLRFADPGSDTDLVEITTGEAEKLLSTAPEIVEQHLKRWLPERETYLGV